MLHQRLLLQGDIGHTDGHSDGSNAIRGNVLIDGQNVGTVFRKVVDDRGQYTGDVLHGKVEGDDISRGVGVIVHHPVLVLVKSAAGDVGKAYCFGGIACFAGGKIFFCFQHLFKDVGSNAFFYQQIFFFIGHDKTFLSV